MVVLWGMTFVFVFFFLIFICLDILSNSYWSYLHNSSTRPLIGSLHNWFYSLSSHKWDIWSYKVKTKLMSALQSFLWWERMLTRYSEWKTMKNRFQIWKPITIPKVLYEISIIKKKGTKLFEKFDLTLILCSIS